MTAPERWVAVDAVTGEVVAGPWSCDVPALEYADRRSDVIAMTVEQQQELMPIPLEPWEVNW